jgi:hypothetical protein
MEMARKSLSCGEVLLSDSKYTSDILTTSSCAKELKILKLGETPFEIREETRYSFTEKCENCNSCCPFLNIRQVIRKGKYISDCTIIKLCWNSTTRMRNLLD